MNKQQQKKHERRRSEAARACEKEFREREERGCTYARREKSKVFAIYPQRGKRCEHLDRIRAKPLYGCNRAAEARTCVRKKLTQFDARGQKMSSSLKARPGVARRLLILSALDGRRGKERCEQVVAHETGNCLVVVEYYCTIRDEIVDACEKDE